VTISRGSAHYLAERQRVDPEVVVDCFGQQILCGRVTAVVTVQVGDEDTGVEDYHAGQPSRTLRS